MSPSCKPFFRYDFSLCPYHQQVHKREGFIRIYRIYLSTLYRSNRDLLSFHQIEKELKRESIKLYFSERCGGGPKSRDFWPTIRPFLSNKGSISDEKITISENSKIITDTSEICNKFNTFFVNVAKDIGSDSVCLSPEDHPSIQAIKANVPLPEQKFDFSPVSEEKVTKYLNRIGLRKATGLDGISSKILHLTKPVIVNPITVFVNRMIQECEFPNPLKYARVTPIYKKKDPLDCQNYRPVSILPTVSKNFERSLEEQLSQYFENLFNPYLSAFRKGYSCQSVLLSICEEWRSALDRGDHVAAILMDLSKAFDCLPPSLIRDKLTAYGLSQKAVNIISSYLSDRKQCVQIGNHCSTFQYITKGVPQGSILGPLLFNIFLNDIFYFIKEGKLFNYADDNTLSYSHPVFATLVEVLERESGNLVEWFTQNQMKANPDKFQAVAVGERAHGERPTFRIGEAEIECDETVKLLGVDIDFRLNFDNQISNICRKASQQINVLKRIGKFLNFESRKTIYHAFIMSNFNFCPLIWHFCSKGNTEKLEKIHFRALKFIYQDFNSNYEVLLEKAGSTTLHLSRLRMLAIETFKIVYGISPSYLKDFICLKQTSYNFRYTNLLEVPRPKSTKYGTNSFRFQAAKLWNSLPEEARKITDFNSFRAFIRGWSGTQCRCALCR